MNEETKRNGKSTMKRIVKKKIEKVKENKNKKKMKERKREY